MHVVWDGFVVFPAINWSAEIRIYGIHIIHCTSLVFPPHPAAPILNTAAWRQAPTRTKFSWNPFAAKSTFLFSHSESNLVCVKLSELRWYFAWTCFLLAVVKNKQALPRGIHQWQAQAVITMLGESDWNLTFTTEIGLVWCPSVILPFILPSIHFWSKLFIFKVEQSVGEMWNKT